MSRVRDGSVRNSVIVVVEVFMGVLLDESITTSLSISMGELTELRIEVIGIVFSSVFTSLFSEIIGISTNKV
jgi:hypothetical protein